MAFDNEALKVTVRENFGGDWSIFRDTANAFLEGVEECIGALNSAMSSGELEAIVRAAHRLKGETGLFHKIEVYQAFEKIEKEGRASVKPTEKAISEAVAMTRQLVAELNEILSARAKNAAA